MAFPGTYNINYYYGDTYEFNVIPKKTDGSSFGLTTTEWSAKFTIAPTRGAALADQISCYAIIQDSSTIRCAIRPEDALNLDSSIQYVYDVEISKAAEPFDIVYTVLTGNLTITRDITTPESGAPEPIPNNPTDLVIGTITDTTIPVSWTAPAEGGAVTDYKVAIIPFTTDSATLESAIENATVTISADQTSYTFFGLTENTDYSVLILSINDTGEALYSSVLTNTNAITTADNPATTEPDFFVTNDGTSAYLIDGVSNDTITVVRGQTYTISVNASGHPFWIQTVPAPYDSGNVYSVGIANNGTDLGTITWTVANDAPDTLFYACQFHSSMGGIIDVIDGSS